MWWLPIIYTGAHMSTKSELKRLNRYTAFCGGQGFLPLSVGPVFAVVLFFLFFLVPDFGRIFLRMWSALDFRPGNVEMSFLPARRTRVCSCWLI